MREGKVIVDGVIEPFCDAAIAGADVGDEVVAIFRIDAFYLQKGQMERRWPSAREIHEALHGCLFEINQILPEEEAQVSSRESKV